MPNVLFNLRFNLPVTGRENKIKHANDRRQTLDISFDFHGIEGEYFVLITLSQNQQPHFSLFG